VTGSGIFGRTSFLYEKMRFLTNAEENLTMTGQEAGFLDGIAKAESMMKRREGNGISNSPFWCAATSTGFTMVSYTWLRMAMGESSFLTARPRMRMEVDLIACSQLLICSECFEIISSFLELAPRLFSSAAAQCSAEMSFGAAGRGGGNQRQGGPNLDKGNREHPVLGKS